MQTRRLGNSDLDITPVGFGAWAIGGGEWAGGWGSQDDQDSIAAINHALDQGMNWIDTAAVYGLGRSEQVVAKALEGRPEKPYIFTKSTLKWNENREVFNSQQADSIRQEVEDSLRRLQVEVIDLYQVHWPTPDEDIEEGWATMVELQQAGKVRWVGVSNFSVEQMERIRPLGAITSLQPPYSAIRPDVESEILPYCERNDIGVIVYSPMQSGLLTGKMTAERIQSLPDDDWRKNAEDFQEPKLGRNLELAELMGEIGKRHGRSGAEVAIAWTLRLSAVTGAIVGARRPDQIDGIIGAMEFRLGEDEIQEIATFQSNNMAVPAGGS